jgi:hypothetical protein
MTEIGETHGSHGTFRGAATTLRRISLDRADGSAVDVRNADVHCTAGSDTYLGTEPAWKSTRAIRQAGLSLRAARCQTPRWRCGSCRSCRRGGRGRWLGCCSGRAGAERHTDAVARFLAELAAVAVGVALASEVVQRVEAAALILHPATAELVALAGAAGRPACEEVW